MSRQFKKTTYTMIERVFEDFFGQMIVFTITAR